MTTIKREIKYDADRERSFAREIIAMPGCEKLRSCIQCGTCSAACPMSVYMDYTPRRIIYLTRACFKKEVLKSNTIWLCSSCYVCTVECPKGIKITDIMYALKQKAIEDGTYPRSFPVPVLAREFYKMVRTWGRSSESRLILYTYLKTNLLGLPKMSGLGLKLMRTGRFSLRQDAIKGREQLARMLDSVEAAKGRRK